ncbi:S8 family serine peptidase [Paenibacillus sp. FSL H8-0537]|uniref:S8 family serine peptidase n=1 Tax=Paenibacillus sp. FSL H8-0537 TaxID=2921399 RepID=UPI00310127E7
MQQWYKRKTSRNKQLSILIVMALLLTLLLPAGAMGAEAAPQSLKSSILSEQLKLPKSAYDQVDSAGKKESAGLLGAQGEQRFKVEAAGSAAEGTTPLLITPQNYVPHSDSGKTISVIVELVSDPIAVQSVKAQQGQAKSIAGYQTIVKQEQSSFAAAARKLNVKLGRQYQQIFNGYSVQVPANQVDKLLALPGVKAIYPNSEIIIDPQPSVEAKMDESVPFIGTPVYWDSGLTGEGIKVGVIDSGIDYLHPSLKDAYKGGYDFVDNDNDPYETLPDPNDAEVATSHGTHVAGTVAGRGDPEHPDGESGWVKGVAYGADIYAYRVLGPKGRGSTENVIAAMERSVIDGMDIINLSLGDDFNDQFEASAVALNNVMLAGVVAVAANGNDGPEPYTVGVPATAELAISVGASSPPLSVPVLTGSGVDTVYGGYMTYSPELGNLENNALELVYTGLGTAEDFIGKDVTGKAALISRGSITFGEKALNALNAGAAAVIIYNNATGGFSGTLNAGVDYVPTLSISQEDGLALKAKVDAAAGAGAGGYAIDFGTTVEQDMMGDFSSRGPSLPGLAIKPDITAPGVAIRSSIPAYGGDYSDAYENKQGTSMASPHIAGAAALLLQKERGLTPFEVKGLLMNNAKKLADRSGERYSHMDQGAGRIDLEQISHAKAIALVEETTVAVAGAAATSYLTGSLSFGAQAPGDESAKTIQVKDISGAASSYAVSTIWYGDAAGELSVSEESFAVAAGGTASFDVALQVAEAAEDGRYEGEVVIQGGGQTIQLPLAVYVGDVELPAKVSEITLEPFLFSPNGDGAADTTDLKFRVNATLPYFSLDVYAVSGSNLSWKGAIVESAQGMTPGSYIVEGWDGEILTALGPQQLGEGHYVVVPWVGFGAEDFLLDQLAEFVLDVQAPVAELADPPIAVTGNDGVISGRIISDRLITLFGDYSAVGAAAIAEDANGDLQQYDATIAADGRFEISVPIVKGSNAFDVYVYDAADNGVIEPAFVVNYESANEQPATLAAVASKSSVRTGETFDIDVNFEHVKGLYAAQFSLTYDSGLVKGTVAPSVTLSTYQQQVNPGGSLIVNETVVDLGSGVARSDYVVSLTGDHSGYSGSGTLATFHFSSGSTGKRDFKLSNARALNSDTQEIAYSSVSDVSVTVTPGPTEPEHRITGKITAEALGSSVNYSETWYQGADGVHKVVVEAVTASKEVAAVGEVKADGSYTLLVPAGTYTVRVVVPGHVASASSVTVAGEDTTLNVGPLQAGDVNSDGKIDLADLQLVAKQFGKSRSTSWANAPASAADINRDNAVDLLDISFVLGNFKL